MEMQVEIRIKKYGISNQPDVCIFDDPCLSKFGALRGSCPHPGDNLQDFRAALTCTSAVKHNRANQMSELSPALISIAGGNEFLFARFYHIYEGVQLVLPESPPIVSGVSDMYPPCVQTWKRHGIRCKHSVGKNAHIFLKRIFHLHFQRKSAYVLLIMLLIT